MTDATLTLTEVRSLSSKIATALIVLQCVHGFWSPSLRRFFARSPISIRNRIEEYYTAARGRPALPRDAEYLGYFEYGINPYEVLDNIDRSWRDVLPKRRAFQFGRESA